MVQNKVREEEGGSRENMESRTSRPQKLLWALVFAMNDVESSFKIVI